MRPTQYLPSQPQPDRLARLKPLVLLLARLHDRDLAHAERDDLLRAPPAAYPPHLAGVEEDAPARKAHELHRAQDGTVVAVLKLCPDALLRGVLLEEGGGGGPCGGAAREGDEEAGAQEDGEDAQVLGGVVDADVLVSCAECVLDACAEVVRSWHFGGELEGGPGRG